MSGATEKAGITLFMKMFLCGTPIRDLPWEKLQTFSTFGEENQGIMLNKTVLHPLCKIYPMDPDYHKFFCKKLMQLVEEAGEAPCEDLYNCYVKLLHGKISPYCFKMYFLPQLSDFVPILCSRNLLSCGTTGLTTWHGAMVLAEWCIANSSLFEGKRVLELGCGAGFAGIVSLKLCSPKCYIFTDYHSQVLSLLKYNVLLNFGPAQKIINLESICLEQTDSSELDVSCKVGETEIHSRCLDWNDNSSCESVINSLGPIDIVVAADVVFDPTLLLGLAQTLFRILSHMKQVGQINSFACFSLAVRNPDTYHLFLKELDDHCLKYSEIVCDFEHVFYFDRTADVRLLKIQLDYSSSNQN